jgi:carbamoyltransferase
MKDYSNQDVLRFYQELPFNYSSSAEDEAAVIRKTNAIAAAYPLLTPLLNNSKHVLDVGCGAGWFSNTASYYYKCRVTGIDFNPKAVTRAREISDSLGTDCIFTAQNLFTYVPAPKFSLVVSLGVLHHTDNCREAVRKVLRDFVNPGGYAFFGLYHKYGRKPFLDHFTERKSKGCSNAELFKEYKRLHPLVDQTMLESWFRDQVLHPKESQHTLEEMLEVMREERYELVSSSLNNFKKIENIREHLALEPTFEEKGRESLKKGKYFPGFFLFLARNVGQKQKSSRHPIRILGISGFYHDSAAAVVSDGEVIAAAQEEQFTRIKHDSGFPSNAVGYCLDEAGVFAAELDAVVFYDKPLLKFERLLETYLAYAPRGLLSFFKAMPVWLRQKLFIPKEIDTSLGNQYDGPIYFMRHHDSHAASAFYPSPFEEAAIICIDGVGEWASTTWGVGRGNRIEMKQEIRFPHSLGLLYSAFTYYLGFTVNSGEYKVMGLAPYGEPKYVQAILAKLIDVKKDGSFWMDQSYFNYCAGLEMTSSKFHKLFGGPPRHAEAKITQREMDIARSIQEVAELVILRIARHVRQETGMKNLCLAGGCALNCVANGKIIKEKIFDNIWIQPAAGDAGGALGAALYGWYGIEGMGRTIVEPDAQKGSYLGLRFSNEEVKRYLDGIGAKYRYYDSEEDLCDSVAGLLAAGKIIGHAAGRMEFGPRALGNRSILGDPRNRDMQKLLNSKIKFRESFRPFAPSCLEEDCHELFDLDSSTVSPYMLLTAPVREKLRRPMTEEEEKLFGIEKLNVARSTLPSVTHVDYSARVQTVNEEVNPRFYRIIRKFKEKTGYGVVVNTSFNIRGEPIVCQPDEAYRCFMFTDMDVLVLEDCICLKTEQPALPGAEEYKKQFKEENMVKRQNIFAEFIAFAKESKSYWIVPIVIILLLMVALLVFTSTSAAPFIYTIF